MGHPEYASVGRLRGASAWMRGIGYCAVLFLVAAVGLAQKVLADVSPPSFGEESSKLPRHPLERAALTDPEGALAAVEEALGRLGGNDQAGQVALLQLARANACRVMGNWNCQRDAGAAAADAARLIEDPVLEVRGLIAEARGAMALDDMVYGEQILTQAELVLSAHPNGELSADVQLAYSSLSYRLGRHQSALAYAQRGLEALADGEALPMRVRLLRNQARARLQLGDFEGVEQNLNAALAVPLRPPDPKLLAEIHLELARLAQRRDDVPAQREHGRLILEIATGLENTQLTGLGHEVLANAALDAGDHVLARAELRLAKEDFARLNLASDELRVIPGLLKLETDPGQITTLAMRLLALDQQVDELNRAQAAADFDIRLQHAQQESTLAQLQANAELAQARVSALRERNQLFAVILILVLLLVATLISVLINQRRSNQRLQEVLESRHRALLITSHELRNPIAGVVGLADLLLRSPLASHQQDMVRALISAAESVGQLSQDLLDRGRAESGELRLSLHPVSLRKLALNLEQLYSVQARSKGIGFALELDQSLITRLEAETRVHCARGDTAAAWVSLHRLEALPDRPCGYRDHIPFELRARIAMAAGRPRETLTWLAKVPHFTLGCSLDEEPHRLEARALHAAGRTEEAIVLLQGFCDAQAPSAFAGTELARLLHAVGREAEARTVAQRSLAFWADADTVFPELQEARGLAR